MNAFTKAKQVGNGLLTILFSITCFNVNPAYSYDTYNVSVKPTVSDNTAPGKLSFNFQNIDIKSLLQLIAKTSGLNFVISDAVKGSITINLKNVTWQQALDIILNSHGLASRKEGNVLYISTIDDISGTETKQFQAQEQLSNLAPLESKIVRLKFTNATDLAKFVKSPDNNLMTPRGQIAVDTRTNSVIIRDVKSNLDSLIIAINKLDIPAKQVLIEARIVNIDVIYEEELGVRFGVSNTSHLSGTFQGANSITSGVSPSSVTNVAGTVDPTQRLNFNIPAAQLFDGSNPGSVALALARLGPILLDLELSALEGESHAQVIARPRVMASNQQKAVIETGQEIPYQAATSSGATSVDFKKAVLSLEITPQITPDNRIILNLKATEDSVGQNINVAPVGANPSNIPAINTQDVQSSVLLNNNETIVLGGVYKQSKVNVIDRIPFVSSLPVVGNLFKHTHEQDEKHELLIFITPKIINSQAEMASYKGENLSYASND